MEDTPYCKSTVWGPHYWFMLHTMVYHYPEIPTSTTKKKYHDFIHNLPLFLPNHIMGDYFSELLDKYPLTPYLDSRDAFIRWMHFIHNKINIRIGKQELSFKDSHLDYQKTIKNITHHGDNLPFILGFVIFLFIVFIFICL